MKKSILNLGKTLNKKEQKKINGGTYYLCSIGYCYVNNRIIRVKPDSYCPDGSIPMC